jgi:hypothetical protein
MNQLNSESGWDINNPVCRKSNPEFRDTITNSQNMFIHTIMYLSTLEFSDYIPNQIDNQNTVHAWITTNVILDTRKFDADIDRYLCEKYPTIKGKTRVLPLELIYEAYINSAQENKVSKNLFCRIITRMLSNYYSNTQITTLFGKKKKFIKDHRYIGH